MNKEKDHVSLKTIIDAENSALPSQDKDKLHFKIYKNSKQLCNKYCYISG